MNDKEPSKSGYFSFPKSISKAKNDLNFSKNGFSPKIALEEQLLLKSFWILSILQKFYLVKFRDDFKPDFLQNPGFGSNPGSGMNYPGNSKVLLDPRLKGNNS